MTTNTFTPYKYAIKQSRLSSTPFAGKMDADLKSLLNILSYRRAPGTRSFAEFCAKIVEPVFGMPDAYGNYVLSIGDAKHCFMAHTDTVESKDGRTRLHVDKNMIIGLAQTDKDSACLGADCGNGVWLILEMIKAKRPGLYVLAAQEEVGCQGSNALARYSSDLFADLDSVISFDRHTHNGNQVITEMVAGPVCSDDYADALCALLGMGYKPSPDGILTDSMEFMDMLPNVTNISVAYADLHTRRETTDFAALRRLRDVLVAADFSTLPTTPKPPKPAYSSFMPDDYDWAWPAGRNASRRKIGYNGPKSASLSNLHWPDHDDWRAARHQDQLDEMADLVGAYPMSVAELLIDLGVDCFELIDHLNRR